MWSVRQGGIRDVSKGFGLLVEEQNYLGLKSTKVKME